MDGWLFGIVCVICFTIIVCKAMDSSNTKPEKPRRIDLNTMAKDYEPPSMNLNPPSEN